MAETLPLVDIAAQAMITPEALERAPLLRKDIHARLRMALERAGHDERSGPVRFVEERRFVPPHHIQQYDDNGESTECADDCDIESHWGTARWYVFFTGCGLRPEP